MLKVLFRLAVPKEGLEPSRPCGHWILNPTRLPIPPLRLLLRKEVLRRISHRRKRLLAADRVHARRGDPANFLASGRHPDRLIAVV